jgi:diguanylate cyclase (GGDEF)-like protein
MGSEIMTYLEESKKKKIYEILSIVKLSSLLFSGIAIFRSLFTDNNTIVKTTYSYNSALSAVLAVLLLSLIYAVWSFSTIKRYNAKHINLIQIVENLLFLLIFFSSVLLSGAELSDYKFLFLFIIITTTIQSGMKQGMAIACVSSIIILSIDLIFGSNASINQQFENDLILAGMFVLTAWPLGFYVKIEGNHIKELEDLVNIDGLTGVYNHRFFHDMLRSQVNSFEKKEKPISLVFIDIDYFKNYNDLYGHQKGDEVLKTIGFLLKNNVRKGDVVARYGGEEFSIILPDTSEEEAVCIAERIRSKIEKAYFEGEENQPNGRLTVSIGLSVYPDKAKNDIELIKSADDALYRAKFFNKNS